MSFRKLIKVACNGSLDATISGKSVRYSQLIYNGDFTDTSGWQGSSGVDSFSSLSASNNVISQTFTSTPDEYYKSGIAQNTNTGYPHVMVAGHKYFAHCDFKSTKNCLLRCYTQPTGYFTSKSVSANVWATFNGIKEATTDNQSASFVLSIDDARVLSAGDILQFKNAMLLDLTEIFGAGNEPSTTQAFYETDLGHVLYAGTHLPNGTGLLDASSPLSFLHTDTEEEIARYTRVGRVNDLSVLSWNDSQSLASGIFSSVISNIKQPTTAAERLTGIYTQKYRVSLSPGINDNMTDKSVLRYGNRLYLRDTSCNNVSELITALSGVYLEYERTTPIKLRSTQLLSSVLGGQDNLALYDAVSMSSCVGVGNHIYAKADGQNIYTKQKNVNVDLDSSHTYLMVKVMDRAFSNDSFDDYAYTESGNVTLTDTYKDVNNGVVLSKLTGKTKLYASHLYTWNASFPAEMRCLRWLAIDLTAYGLASLTSQQFYDRYKNILHILAKGNTAGTCDTFDNASGILTYNVMSVDLGTLNWVYVGSGYTAYSLDIQSIVKRPAIYSQKANILPSKYSVVSEDGVSLNESIAVSTSGVLLLHDDSLLNKTAAEIKSALSGVMLNFELATPVYEQFGTVAIPRQADTAVDANGLVLDLGV